MTFEQFFNSEAKSRLIKFFIYNHHKFFDVSEISKRLNLPGRIVRQNLLKLQEAGFLKSKSSKSFSISYKFPYLNDIRNIVFKFPPITDAELVKAVNKTGKVKLLILAGIFINTDKSRADLLVAGDKISEKKFARFIDWVESKVGKEINYAVMTVQDFKYRKDMFDRFVLDVLEFPHRKVINKLKV